MVDILDDFVSTTGRQAEGNCTTRQLSRSDDTLGNGAATSVSTHYADPVLGPIGDHTLCALVNDLRVCARYAPPLLGPLIACDLENVSPLLTGGQVVRLQLRAVARMPSYANSVVSEALDAGTVAKPRGMKPQRTACRLTARGVESPERC